jgi:hypothetical protein
MQHVCMHMEKIKTDRTGQTFESVYCQLPGRLQWWGNASLAIVFIFFCQFQFFSLTVSWWGLVRNIPQRKKNCEIQIRSGNRILIIVICQCDQQ